MSGHSAKSGKNDVECQERQDEGKTCSAPHHPYDDLQNAQHTTCKAVSTRQGSMKNKVRTLVFIRKQNMPSWFSNVDLPLTRPLYTQRTIILPSHLQSLHILVQR